MLYLSDRVAKFLKKNREYEIMGLMILLIVGGMMVTEGAHLAHMKLFDHEIHAMSKGAFWLVLFVVVLTEILQTIFKRLEENADGYKE
jgi:predicted tellurium resistance membrane protein TerC